MQAGSRQTASSEALLAQYGNTTKEDLEKTKVDVTLAGRIVAMRSFGKACFCHIQDGSGRIQLYFQKNTLGEEQYALFKKIDIGDFIGIKGFPVPDQDQRTDDRCGGASRCSPSRSGRCPKNGTV